MRTQEQDTRGGQRVVSAIVNADGTTASPNVTVTKTGTGAYTVRVNGYRAILTASVAPVTGVIFAVNVSQQPNTITVATFNSSTLAALDSAYKLSIDGWAK